MESKRSRSRSSTSSHRSGSSSAACLSSAFTFDGIGAGDLQLDNVGADQSEINDLLETLQSPDGAALMSDLTEGGCVMPPFDSLDSLNFGFSSSNSLSQEMMRPPRDTNGVLGYQNNDILLGFDGTSSQTGSLSGT